MAAVIAYQRKSVHGTFERTTEHTARLTQNGPCYVRQITVSMPSPAYEEVHITIDAGAGNDWDAEVATLHFKGQRYAVWEPEYNLILFEDDTLVVTCAGPRAIAIIAEVG